MAGLPCTQWIARCAGNILEKDRPDLTLVYLPHLDYDPQRFGPAGCDMKKLTRQLDDACAPIFDVAKKIGATIWVISEYGHCQVSRAVYLNRVLRSAGLLSVRPGPFGEQLDTFTSRAFAVCDHQLAHVYVPDHHDLPKSRELLGGVPGVGRILAGEERVEFGLDHERSGELILLSDPDAWFAYPFWLDDSLAPDYARCVAIHHKPGYDPCELLVDPKHRFPKLKVARKLLAKKLGFRMLMDMIPLDAAMIKGSHGLRASDPMDRPLWIGTGANPGGDGISMTVFAERVIQEMT
jgi:predicted AlkP superfamily pyrophosphatase or phosphodiesterase